MTRPVRDSSDPQPHPPARPNPSAEATLLPCRDMPDDIAKVARLLRHTRRLLVFTGAGVSTDSGIPDFRGPDGLWKRVDPDDFTIARYLSSSEVRKRSWARWSTSPIRHARPNAAHRAVAELAQMGRLEGCVTQNIDGLHQAAGLTDDLVVEVHGNVWSVRCLACPARWPAGTVFDRVQQGEEDPHCPQCGGLIKLTVVSFGQAIPPGVMDRAHAMARRADGVVAVGTTLSVWPAAEIPLAAAERGIPFVIVNLGATDFDDLATVKVAQPAGPALTRLVTLLADTRSDSPSGSGGG